MNKIRYGITGFGKFAEEKILPAIRASHNSELVSIQKRNKSDAEDKAEYYKIPYAFDSVEELVKHSEVDAVFIVSPNNAHEQETILAAKAGKHVLTEKPMAMNSCECENMINICKENNVKLMVAHMARFSPVNTRIKELVKSGIIGNINFVRSEFCYDLSNSKRTWATDMKIAGGGPTYDIGVHCLDTLRFILNDEVISVKSQLNPTPTEETTEMISLLALKFSKGIPASIYTSFATPILSVSIELIGNAGIISAPNFSFSELKVPIKIQKCKNGEIIETIIEEIDVPDIYEKEVTHFSNCILNNTEPMIPGEEGLKNQIVLDESIKVI